MLAKGNHSPRVSKAKVKSEFMKTVPTLPFNQEISSDEMLTHHEKEIKPTNQNKQVQNSDSKDLVETTKALLEEVKQLRD